MAFFRDTYVTRIVPGNEVNADFSKSRLLPFALIVLLSVLFLPGAPFVSPTTAAQTAPNALYLLNQPADYDAFEDLVKSYRETGADTVIIRPVRTSGLLDRKLLAKSVFFAHAAGLRLYVLMPTRRMPSVLKEHPEWQDMQYDVRTGRREPTGKLDLFNRYVTV